MKQLDDTNLGALRRVAKTIVISLKFWILLSAEMLGPRLIPRAASRKPRAFYLGSRYRRSPEAPVVPTRWRELGR